jgi:prevent-host-death family protein
MRRGDTLLGGRSQPTDPCATMQHMSAVEVRELQRNASAVVTDAAAGETVMITDRGRPVAQLTAIPRSRLRALIETGRARPPRRSLAELPPPDAGPDLSVELAAMRPRRAASR